MEDRLTVSVKEPAAIAGIGQTRMYHLAKYYSRCPAIHLGRRVRIDVSRLQGYINYLSGTRFGEEA